MGNRRFEMYQLRNILVRMRQGESDRSWARLGLMSRDKCRQLRRIESAQGWLDSIHPLPDNEILDQVLSCKVRSGSGPISSVEPYREQVVSWMAQGVEGKAIHQALVRNHQYQGSYSSIY